MSTATSRFVRMFVGTRSARTATAALALSLVLLGCGGGDVARGSVALTGVPAAQIYVDGESFGSTPVTLSALTLDASLDALDPTHPVVIARLASAHGIDVAPFEAPAVLRGRSPRACAVLLWPSKDVRAQGVVNFAIEADGCYAGDATLEFRRGRKVLYREPFIPQSVTTVRKIPDEVHEHLRVGRTISWGLYFDDHRKPIRTKFRVVQRPNADRQIAKLRGSRHMARQSRVTRELIQATVLENNRLYTEALVANLGVMKAHPSATQPIQGIVTTLRRLDADDSELYAVVARAVGGRGGRVHGGVAVRGGTTGLVLEPWIPAPTPTPTIEPPSPSDAPDMATPMGPGARGVTPPPQTGSEAPTPTTDEPTTPVAPNPIGDGIETMKAALADAEEQAAGMQRDAHDAMGRLDAAEQAAQDAEQAAETAETAAQAAHEAAEQARQVVQNNPNPTTQELQDMATTGQAEEDAREAADTARTTAEEERRAANEARDGARDLEHQASERAAAVAEMRRALEATQGQMPGEPGSPPAEPAPTPDAATLEGNVLQAERQTTEAQAAMDDARTQLEQAGGAHQNDPSESTHATLQDAIRSFERAAEALKDAQDALIAAQQALATVGDPAESQPPLVIK